jgi:hydrogenase nickel incorporation protein HypB
MCATCGCSDETDVRVGTAEGHGHSRRGVHEQEHGHVHGHVHEYEHAHQHAHAHGPVEARTVRLEQAILAKNDLIAARNRGWLEGREIVALNLVSAPGAGKTTLLERTIRALGGERPVAVIEGDQETERDAARIRAAGAAAIQVNTGSGCHLDADMVARALRALDPPRRALLLIENVGNLVCPALFDLGEHAKVVVASVTEGEDKPLKYPHMFRASRLMLLNKIDLLPHLDFDVEQCRANARRVNPALELIELSATRGDGIDRWCAWLRIAARL